MKLLFSTIQIIFLICTFSCSEKKSWKPTSPWYQSKNENEWAEARETNWKITLLENQKSFTLPKSYWIRKEFRKWIYLTRNQLKKVAISKEEREAEFTSICNAAFPFDRCAVHISAAPPMRVYILNEDIKSTKKNFENIAKQEVIRFRGKKIEIQKVMKNDWHKVTVNYIQWYRDYGVHAVVDCRLISCNRKTYVFVFLYSESPNQRVTLFNINSILKSFDCEPNPRNGK